MSIGHAMKGSAKSLTKLLWLLTLALPLHAAAETVEYVHTDALGTPIAVTDASGNLIETSEYEPYGKLLNRPLTDGPGFTGHVQDAATGLTYMQQRYYDPVIGRFLSVDPIGTDVGKDRNFNGYWYGNNNPFAFSDPDGRCTGSHIESKDGTCVSSGDFTTQGPGPTMRGAQSVVHQAYIEAQLGFDPSGAFAAADVPTIPMFCESPADCATIRQQNLYSQGKISRDELMEHYEGQGGGVVLGVGALGVGYVAVRFPAVLSATGTAIRFIRLGYEISAGKNFRIAPFGNRTGHPLGRFPHYHRRVTDPKGETMPGQGIGRHRPWESKSTDKSFWDKF